MCDPRVTEEYIIPEEPDHEDIVYPPVENFFWRNRQFSCIAIKNFKLSLSEIDVSSAIYNFIQSNYDENLKFSLDTYPGEYPEYFKIRHKMILDQIGGDPDLSKRNLKNIILNLKKKGILESKTKSSQNGGSISFYRFTDLFYRKFINEEVCKQFYDNKFRSKMSKKNLSNKKMKNEKQKNEEKEVHLSGFPMTTLDDLPCIENSPMTTLDDLPRPLWMTYPDHFGLPTLTTLDDLVNITYYIITNYIKTNYIKTEYPALSFFYPDNKDSSFNESCSCINNKNKQTYQTPKPSSKQITDKPSLEKENNTSFAKAHSVNKKTIGGNFLGENKMRSNHVRSKGRRLTPEQQKLKNEKDILDRKNFLKNVGKQSRESFEYLQELYAHLEQENFIWEQEREKKLKEEKEQNKITKKRYRKKTQKIDQNTPSEKKDIYPPGKKQENIQNNALHTQNNNCQKNENQNILEQSCSSKKVTNSRHKIKSLTIDNNFVNFKNNILKIYPDDKIKNIDCVLQKFYTKEIMTQNFSPEDILQKVESAIEFQDIKYMFGAERFFTQEYKKDWINKNIEKNAKELKKNVFAPIECGDWNENEIGDIRFTGNDYLPGK